MDTDFPFSASFGLADTRENCVASAQDVYQRLLLRHEDENYGVLKFDTFAVVALNRKGVLDTEKIKELIRVFRPNRDGSLNMLDFVRSVDSVYKELRLLRATVASSSKIDKALESIMNIFFYAIMTTIILSQIGFDPLTLFLSMSSIILAFAFMIGSASAKYFDVRCFPKCLVSACTSGFLIQFSHFFQRDIGTFAYPRAEAVRNRKMLPKMLGFGLHFLMHFSHFLSTRYRETASMCQTPKLTVAGVDHRDGLSTTSHYLLPL